MTTVPALIGAVQCPLVSWREAPDSQTVTLQISEDRVSSVTHWVYEGSRSRSYSRDGRGLEDWSNQCGASLLDQDPRTLLALRKLFLPESDWAPGYRLVYQGTTWVVRTPDWDTLFKAPTLYEEANLASSTAPRWTRRGVAGAWHYLGDKVPKAELRVTKIRKKELL